MALWNLYKDLTHCDKSSKFSTSENGKHRQKLFIRVNMAKFENMLVALLICALIPNITHVDANFSKSMYLTWGAQHASILGEDLHLVLDRTSGETFMFTVHPLMYQYIHFN